MSFILFIQFYFYCLPNSLFLAFPCASHYLCNTPTRSLACLHTFLLYDSPSFQPSAISSEFKSQADHSFIGSSIRVGVMSSFEQPLLPHDSDSPKHKYSHLLTLLSDSRLDRGTASGQSYSHRSLPDSRHQ